jgi:predicted Zn-dependent protease
MSSAALRVALVCAALVLFGDVRQVVVEEAPDELLSQHRNLGKAFYENPTTQYEAVEEFRKALELAPGSPRERLNYALALLRAGKTDDGVAELEKVQRQDPQIPHTWFNLGIQ